MYIIYYTWLHCSETDPTGSQLQGSHPFPLAIFQWLGLHSSQDNPMTLGKQGHCPVVELHTLDCDPKKSQVHSVN